MNYQFRVTTKNFTQPAVTHQRMHYFPYDDHVNMQGEKLAMGCAYYSQSRGKWLCDTTYFVDKALTKSLFDFAVARKLIPAIPAVVTTFIGQGE